MACNVCHAITGILTKPDVSGNYRCWHDQDNESFVVCPACNTQLECRSRKCVQKAWLAIALGAVRNIKSSAASVNCRRGKHHVEHSKRRSFACAFCEKRFKAKKELVTHLSIHYDLKPHVCESCGRSFREDRTMRRHQRRVHERRFWGCPFCQEVTVNREGLIEHFKEHGYPFKCSCPSAIRYQEELKSHQIYCRQIHDLLSDDS